MYQSIYSLYFGVVNLSFLFAASQKLMTIDAVKHEYF
uniref:Uncharacterized protein n=1 Tax=Rhizophora mucronata TaxID=61149 RepID=A0A2P2NWS8_RHIMU